MYSISQLFIYPVKSLGGIEVPAARLTDRGFQYDRRWMLVDASNHFLTQREYPAMSLLQTSIEDDNLVIYHKNDLSDKLRVPLHPAPAECVAVKVWDDQCEAQFVGEIPDNWFSEKLAMSCRLVYMPELERRKVDVKYAIDNDITSFSDGYPLLMIGQASLDDLNSRLEQTLPINRFRPNIVFTGGLPYAEDTMEHLVINGIDLFGVKLCARCVLTTIDQSNGIANKEPLKTLAGYRMANNKIYFGHNMLFKQTGWMKVGDVLEVLSNKPSIEFISKNNNAG
jgi:uncharacterized protein YcbX